MMRFPLALGFCWVLLASPLSVAADKPIPQDPARMKQFSDVWLAWNRATLGDAYAKVGKQDPKWDQPAREALDRAARMFSHRDDPLYTAADVFQAASRAVDAGCDDPMILYLYAQTSINENAPGVAEKARRVRQAGDAMVAGAYPPIRRAVAVLKMVQLRAQNQQQNAAADGARAIESGVDQVLTLFAESVTVDPRGEIWEARWHEILWSVFWVLEGLEDDYKRACDRLDARLAKIADIEPLRLSLKGRFFMKWAWDARTDRMAAFVTEKQFATFEQRLIESRRVLEAAYKLNPKQPVVARTMLEVHKGLGGEDDRATMELWFERAMESDPYDMDACWNKMDWLDPKWHGDPEGREMLEFGKSCAATHNWITGIDLLGADAIIRQYARDTRADGGKYLTRDENWAMIESVNEEYLKHFPNDYGALTKYAFNSFWAGRIELSHQLFERLGDHLTAWTYAPTIEIEQIRKARDMAAKYVADRKAGAKPK